MPEWLSVWSKAKMICIWSIRHAIISYLVKLQNCSTFLVLAYSWRHGKKPIERTLPLMLNVRWKNSGQHVEKCAKEHSNTSSESQWPWPVLWHHPTEYSTGNLYVADECTTALRVVGTDRVGSLQGLVRRHALACRSPYAPRADYTLRDSVEIGR